MQVAARIPDTFSVQIFQLQNPPFFFFLKNRTAKNFTLLVIRYFLTVVPYYIAG
jgi:hypothetical protein